MAGHSGLLGWITSLVVVILAIFAFAHVHGDDNYDGQQQQPIAYRGSPVDTTINTNPASEIAALKPSSFKASAKLKAKTAAEAAVIQIQVEAKAASETAATALARARRQEIEDLIQTLSHDTSEILQRSDYIGRSGPRFSLGGRGKASSSEEEIDSVAATGHLSARITDFAALQRFVARVEEDEDDVIVQSIEWKLTATTKEKVRHALRGDALAQLCQVGKEYEDAFGVVLDSMYDYSEEDPRGRLLLDSDDRDDGEDDVSSRPLWGWDAVRKFFAAEDDDSEEARAEPRIGKVPTVLHVRCMFSTAEGWLW